jgi:hypothetical protein
MRQKPPFKTNNEPENPPTTKRDNASHEAETAIKTNNEPEAESVTTEEQCYKTGRNRH